MTVYIDFSTEKPMSGEDMCEITEQAITQYLDDDMGLAVEYIKAELVSTDE